MNNTRITLLGSHNINLKEWLSGDPDGYERCALVLFRKLARQVNGFPESIRFLAVDIIRMTDDWIIDSSAEHITINMRKFPEVYYRCEKENLELGFVHSHPLGNIDFSPQDDINEKNILHGLSGCNGSGSFLISLIFSNNRWNARVSNGNSFGNFMPARHISVLSERIEMHGLDDSNELPEILKRQEAAFGKPFNNQLQSLRVAVVGLGGTGSALVTMLARAGVGEIILIDGDTVDISNLNRVRGYTSNDVKENKAISLKKFIDGLGLNTVTVSFSNYLHDSPEAIDAISSSDVIFGCTDDAMGRDILNQSVYYYAQPLIDVGLTGFIDKDSDGVPYLRDHRGRVSCILPESGACLRCQGVFTDKDIEFEQAIKDKPELAKLDAETLKKEYYLVGGGEQAPGVGPFTSMTAENGVATLMNLLRNFRDIPSDLRSDNIWIDFIHLCIHSNQPKEDSECIYCKKHQILLKKEEYRLDMPHLGKIEI